jgi:toluene monooxygenase system ferredoxin subunit
MFRRVAAQDALWAGEMRPVEVDGRRVLLVNVDGRINAFEDRCAHKGVPLSQGRLRGAELVCWAHEWQYDACTGEGTNPRGVSVRRFPVEVRDGDIWVDVAERTER